MRVVSHTCSNTEIVCALGCADLLVGVDDHSDYPADVVRNLPRIGPDLSIDVAKVRQLKPDLVLTSLTVPGHEKIVAALKDAGLTMLVVEPVSLEDVYCDILRISAALGVVIRGQQLVARMRAEAATLNNAAIERPRILVEWWPKPVIVPCRRSWVSDMITTAGAANPWSDRDCKSSPVTDDEVLSADPQAIILSWCGVSPEKVRPDIVRRRSSWRDVQAIRKDRIYCVPEALMGRPGPRLVEGIRALRKIAEELSVQ
jgi:iron complex transport system substrate-binding protein